MIRSPAPSSLRLRSMMPLFIVGALCLYFAFYLMFGPRGYLSLQQAEETLAVKEAEHHHLKSKRVALESDVRLMRPGSLDADMADEQVRRTLGYVKPDEIIVNTE